MKRPKIEDFKPKYTKGVAEIASVAKQYVKALEIYIDYLEQGQLLPISSVVRSISVYSNCEDERLDYRKNYLFHHFVSKRKALIEDKESGKIMEVHYSNFRFS